MLPLFTIVLFLNLLFLLLASANGKLLLILAKLLIILWRSYKRIIVLLFRCAQDLLFLWYFWKVCFVSFLFSIHLNYSYYVLPKIRVVYLQTVRILAWGWYQLIFYIWVFSQWLFKNMGVVLVFLVGFHIYFWSVWTKYLLIVYSYFLAIWLFIYTYFSMLFNFHKIF